MFKINLFLLSVYKGVSLSLSGGLHRPLLCCELKGDIWSLNTGLFTGHNCWIFCKAGNIYAFDDHDFLLHKEVMRLEQNGNSSPPRAAYMRQWIGSALVQIIPIQHKAIM